MLLLFDIWILAIEDILLLLVVCIRPTLETEEEKLFCILPIDEMELEKDFCMRATEEIEALLLTGLLEVAKDSPRLK